MPKNKKNGFKFRNTDQTNFGKDDEVCIPRLSSIFLAVIGTIVMYIVTILST